MASHPQIGLKRSRADLLKDQPGAKVTLPGDEFECKAQTPNPGTFEYFHGVLCTICAGHRLSELCCSNKECV